MFYIILSTILLFFSSNALAECRKYLVVYPTNYNFNNSRRILKAWNEQNQALVTGCDELLSTKKARITFDEINMDFYSYYGILRLTNTQVDYIRKNTGATHLVKLVQSIAANDIALIPVIINLKTRLQVYDYPFKQVTFFEGEASGLLDLNSLNAVISTLMTWILPNSFTLGVGYSLFPNTINEEVNMGQQMIKTAESGQASFTLYIESIYPPFSFDHMDWQFQVYGSMGFALQFNNSQELETSSGSVNYDTVFAMANPKLVFQASLHTDIGSFFGNVSPGWAGVYFDDNFDNKMFKGVMSIGVGFGYRYFLNRNVHFDWINNATRFFPELVKNQFLYSKYQLVSVLGVGYYVPDMYDRIFEWFDD